MDDFDKGCEQLSIPKFKVGDSVRISAKHIWADHLGTVARFETIKTTNQKRPIVRLLGACGYEVFLMSDNDAEVIWEI